MEQNKCKYAKDGKCTNPNAEAVDCPTETYDKDSSYSDCDWFENVSFLRKKNRYKEWVIFGVGVVIPDKETGDD